MSELPVDIKTIFADTLEKQTRAERDAYLSIACRGDPALRQRVEELLQAYEEAHDVPDTPIVTLDVPQPDTLLTEGPGTVIGRYKLLEKIGEGGMAVVYMAEQTEPIRRKVALKIIKLGMDTRQVIARFEAERQALALMDHPSIAKVLDAGATETGRPYFVMELVTGVSITEYCDKNSLSTKDRLALFLQVCHAVQHAHQKGIIHRDIKPSNVMVAHHDGKPVPKVIDFGIAKATDQKLTEKTLFTRYAHIIGTPAYMSPEQAELTDLDIDTRSDIYSLGVLLYELLTGTTPFSEEELRRAGYIEMQRVIREQEPVKPSTKLSTLGETLTDIAKHRNCTPDLLRRTIRGDLDWIVMRSLEKDRVRRYETASGLAEDIRRHLESEPILARGPSTTYHLRKFLRRHRVQVLVGLTVAVLIAVVAVILSIWNQDRLQWNRDRLRLAAADELREQALLSQGQGQYASGERNAALETIQPILDSPQVGGKAQLLRAGILVDNRRFDEATAILKTLLQGRQEIAGAAHALLARILWESDAPDAERLKQIEEHRRLAKTLLPETAEAYFQRAMTAVTIKDQLAGLNRALQLDPDHYESLRLRAFTYYASRKYDRLRDDALGMTYLRRRDPLGYSLRATALRELGKYEDAVSEYDNAMALLKKEDPQYLDLATQRSETLLRLGDYQRVVADAEAYRKLWPEQIVFRYQLFCALTALGDYNKAESVFREISRSSPTARNEFWFWATKHVFDILEAGRSWHAPNQEPIGAAFLPMREAQDAYRRLSAKAHRVTTNGFSGHWSPDGKKLAFSMGVHGYSGVALYDPATKETELLIVPGKDPKWSPDGQYIAFVRDCQALRLEEFFAVEDKKQSRPMTEEEVWVMKSDGTEPQRLARGGWPSWRKDSTHIYYHSRVDRALCSVSVEGGDTEPERIVACPSAFPSVSPDGRRVVYSQGEFLKVLDLATRTPVAQWRVPTSAWGGPAWSPAGDELCLGGPGGGENRTGLWIYRFDRNEPAKVLDGQITAASWTPDGTKLVFWLGAYLEIWAADLNPDVSALESLGPGRTLEEHFRDILALYTRRIEADPQDAYAYSSRAECYDRLHERARANTDMRRWSAVMKGESAPDWPFGTSHDFRRVLGMPFDCELVFSAERPVNAIPMMSIAFGQKGRCEVKTFRIPMLIVSLFGLGLLSAFDAPPAYADFTFGTPTNLGPPINTPGDMAGPCFSSDGLELYLDGVRPGGYGNWDVWVARRATTEDSWGEPVNLGPSVNGSAIDYGPSISADGLELHFSSNRGGGNWDLWVATRATVSDPWGQAVNLGSTVNGPSMDLGPSISADGLELFFCSDRAGGSGGGDLWVTTRESTHHPWRAPINLGAAVNSPNDDNSACISPDGLVLFFESDRPGGYGALDLWMTRRATKNDKWGPAVNLGPPINTATDDCVAGISPDGRQFYFVGINRPGGLGGYGIWQTPIIPGADFNGDGKVDAADIGILLAHWGQSNADCDVGPFAWGDGVVDEKDLAVLMESLVTPGPQASDVPCDVILSWASPALAPTCDVYLGTSSEVVSTASRANPQGVLVSLGQTATTYDPPGVLEVSRTYYWRMDFVSAGPTATIYKGPIWKFTTAALTYPIKNVTAKASSAQAGSGPEKTVDRSGLDKSDGHSTDQKDMWWSLPTSPHWIQYEFDKVYTLHEMWVWNMNQIIEPFVGFGARTVKIEYSTDGTTWTALANVPEFAKATGKPGYTANTIVSFGGVSAKHVKLTIEKGWGSTPSAGLSEVRFFAIQSTAVPKP